jgi:hypothetical protein
MTINQGLWGQERRTDENFPKLCKKSLALIVPLPIFSRFFFFLFSSARDVWDLYLSTNRHVFPPLPRRSGHLILFDTNTLTQAHVIYDSVSLWFSGFSFPFFFFIFTDRPPNRQSRSLNRFGYPSQSRTPRSRRVAGVSRPRRTARLRSVPLPVAFARLSVGLCLEIDGRKINQTDHVFIGRLFFKRIRKEIAQITVA